MNEIVNLRSISDVHRMLGIGRPKHPLVMVIANHCIDMDIAVASYSTEMYTVAMKDGMSGVMKYGRSTYDFDDGVMLFLAPGQVITPVDSVIDKQTTGWTLLFHPDLIRRTSLGKKINQYSFFSYDVNEALHISDGEIQTLTELVNKVSRELDQNIDKHTENLISANIELLLDYCTRFYDRQFYTRTNRNTDTVVAFESLLRDYFQRDESLENGIPSVAYCGKALGITPSYLSDLLKKETGKTAREHIHLFLIELAKNKLLGSSDSISKIAFDLGFDYPAHFTKLFKKNTGYSPSKFRVLN